MMDDDLTAVRPDGSKFIPVHFVDHETQRIVCSPNLSEMHAAHGRPVPYPRSGDVQAVTCPRCLATQTFHKAMGWYKLAMKKIARGK